MKSYPIGEKNIAFVYFRKYYQSFLQKTQERYDKHAKRLEKLNALQNIVDKEYSETKMDEKFYKRREGLLKKAKKINTPMQVSIVGKVMNITTANTYRYLRSAREKIKNELLETEGVNEL